MPKILLIEDDPKTRMIVQDILHAHGHEVLLAQDGAFGVSMSALERPDLIILDIMMPVMDGVEALHTLKNDPNLPDVPVIVLTALSDPEIEIETRELGAVAFLSKPVDVTRLIQAVESVMGANARTH